MKRIVLTGGGTAGHVTPNLALVPKLRNLGYDIHYVGSEKGMEKKLVENEGIKYHGIKAGKLRRYFDVKNFTDTFRIVHGFNQSLLLLRKIKPEVVFSKGGFVACPVVWAAWTLRIPVIIHESDFTPGLANKLSLPYAKAICYTFPETKKYLKKEHLHLTGIPVREELHKGDVEKGRKLCGFSTEKPVLTIIGGSLGSGVINKIIRESLDELLIKYQICHICGKDGMDKSLENKKGYAQFEYLHEELKDIFAASDVFVSRAGATVLFELLAIKKPHLLIPLSKKVSRGDQIHNAISFEKQGFSKVLMEEDMTKELLIKKIDDVYANRVKYIERMLDSKVGDSVNEVVKVIESHRKR